MNALHTVFCTEKRAADLGGAETVHQRAAHEWGPSAVVLLWASDAVPDGMRVVGRVSAHRTGPAFRVALPIALERWGRP